MTDALAVQQQQADLVLPVSGQQIVAALTAYQGLQEALDKAMPDQIMDLEGKKFRKKGYWRAVALAFKLSVEPTEERREVAGSFLDGRPNFGYVVTYKASHSSGREAFGDGACFAVEKARRFKCPHPETPGSRRTLHFPQTSCPDFDPDFQWRTLPGEATEHNVRGHAHTRAMNRAISNLVGFGEVSAEEIDREEAAHTSAATGSSAAPASTPAPAVDATGNTKVKSTQVSKGKNARGEWTLYVVKFEDGREATTFSETIGQHAQRAKESGALVHPVIEEGENKGKKTFTLKEFAALQKAPEVHQDEPVSGPEKMLTVRETKTDPPRWVIQTDKRQVVAIDEVLATQALEARKQGIGLIPVFEVVPAGTAGGSFNKLLNWKHPDAPAATEAVPA